MRLRGDLVTWARNPTRIPGPVSAFSASLAHALFPEDRGAMEDFLTSFFVAPFTGLATGIASATSPSTSSTPSTASWGPDYDSVAAVHPHLHDRPHGLHPKKARHGHQDVGHQGRPSDASGDITQFGALTTALPPRSALATSSAWASGLLFGGPGAIFWMHHGHLGHCQQRTRRSSSAKYRVKDHPARCSAARCTRLSAASRTRSSVAFLAILFALFASLAAFGIGASTQSNSLADALYNTLARRR